jgi:hypothetical protein
MDFSRQLPRIDLLMTAASNASKGRSAFMVGTIVSQYRIVEKLVKRQRARQPSSFGANIRSAPPL